MLNVFHTSLQTLESEPGEVAGDVGLDADRVMTNILQEDASRKLNAWHEDSQASDGLSFNRLKLAAAICLAKAHAARVKIVFYDAVFVRWDETFFF